MRKHREMDKIFAREVFPIRTQKQGVFLGHRGGHGSLVARKVAGLGRSGNI